MGARIAVDRDQTVYPLTLFASIFDVSMYAWSTVQYCSVYGMQ